MSRKFSLFSLFSGAGGLDLGFALSNRFDIVLANEVLPEVAGTYSQNFNAKLVTSSPELSDLPSVFSGDVADLKIENFEGLNPDVVAGGPPCQDFSIVRGPKEERKGLEVKRGRLYVHFVRALIHLQPKVFLFENVPGIISANEKQAYKVILDDFSNLTSRWGEIKKLVGNTTKASPKDYDVIFKEVVNASKLGVPQARRRVIIIGIRKDLANLKWWKREFIRKRASSSIRGKLKLYRKYPLTPLEVFEGKSLPQIEDKYIEVMKSYKNLASEVNTSKALEWKEKAWDKMTFDIILDYLQVNGIKNSEKEELDKAFEEHAELLKELRYSKSVSDISPADNSNSFPKESADVKDRMMHIPPNENHIFVRGTKWKVKGKGMSLIYRRIHPLKPSYTVVAYGGGGTWGYHYKRDRGRLTSRERARLQTFPDDFLFTGNGSEVRAQIGEAVPPLMARRLAESIAFILDELG